MSGVRMFVFWKDEEETQLIEEFEKAGRSPLAIPRLTEQFNRSPEAIRKKLAKLGLKIKPMTLRCAVCGAEFRTKNPRQNHCSRSCWSYHKTMRRRNSERFKIQRKMRRQAAAELALRRMLEESYFPYLPNQLGTFLPSLYLKIVIFNSQERVYGAVLLERQLSRRR